MSLECQTFLCWWSQTRRVLEWQLFKLLGIKGKLGFKAHPEMDHRDPKGIKAHLEMDLRDPKGLGDHKDHRVILLGAGLVLEQNPPPFLTTVG